MKVAEALIDPRVRAGKMYFKAHDPARHDDGTALFRVYSDPVVQSLLGAGTWSTLQKLETEPEPGRTRPYWAAVGSKCSIDWLPEEAELVEPTKEIP